VQTDILKKIPVLKWFVTRKWFQFSVTFPSLIFFYFILISGIIGSPVGNRNITTVFVWILWWFLLITFMVPFGSRVWCTVCPFPFFGEWYQRRTLVISRKGKSDTGQMRGLNKKWPAALSNIWMQNIGFLILCTFSTIMLTRPFVTAVALGGLIVIATILHMIYRGRVFCKYICPVSGFLGLYSMTAMVEIRPKDTNVCKKCREKGCRNDGENGWACPWSLYPGGIERNNYCGFCMECIKTCSHSNMTLKRRAFCKDTEIKGYDEAWKAFIMFSSAILYSVTLLSPWGSVKDWANFSETGNTQGFAVYTATLWLSTLVILPAMWVCASWLGKVLSGNRRISTREIFLSYSYLLVPMGLLAWIAFSLPLVMINGSYVISVSSDPLGWGWNLFGSANLPWTPVFPEYVVYIQILLLISGLFLSLKYGAKIAVSMYPDKNQAILSLIPVGGLCTCFTLLLIRLFAG